MGTSGFEPLLHRSGRTINAVLPFELCSRNVSVPTQDNGHGLKSYLIDVICGHLIESGASAYTHETIVPEHSTAVPFARKNL